MELYVSDLDGTLLNSKAEVSEFTKKILNDLIEKGVNFTVATARTPATVVDILEGIKLKAPVVMMNGVIIYDVDKRKYIDIKNINNDSVNKALKVLEDNKKDGFIYGIKDNHLWVYHKDFTCSMEENFYNERCEKPLKTFVKVKDYSEAIKGVNIINFIIFDKLDLVKKVYEELRVIDGITVDYYKDIYGDGYYLEAYSNEASKANGIKYLSEYIYHSKLITFGDNLNDIPMFKISDECYATDNAVDELKTLATSVIESNNDDGVAKFLINRFN